MKKVRCVETNEVYKSANDAAKLMELCPQSVYQALTKGCAAGKYHFMYVGDDEWFGFPQRRKELEETKAIWDMKREEISLLLEDLFKSWYMKEFTLPECAEISGYSVNYLQKRFRSEKIMRGLD